MEGQCQQMERRLLSWAKATPRRHFNAGRLPCDRDGQKVLEALPVLGTVMVCKHQVPASGMGDNCLRQNTKGNMAECRGVGRHVLIWAPEPGGRSKPSAFVLGLKRLSSKVSVKTAWAKLTALGQVDARSCLQGNAMWKTSASPPEACLGEKDGHVSGS